MKKVRWGLLSTASIGRLVTEATPFGPADAVAQARVLETIRQSSQQETAIAQEAVEQ
jgi:hypothetical protein